MYRVGCSPVLALLLAVLAACGAATPAAPQATADVSPTTTAPAETGELTVFAAASLTDAFTEIGEQFQAAHAGVTITFNFAGSDQLATQIAQGAPADVFASANKKQMDVIIQAGDIISGTQHTFARNRLVVVYPQDNPAALRALADLANPGVKIVLASPTVPVGTYSLAFLAKASQLPDYTEAYSPTVLKNVVSYEENVKAVLTKVTLGEADAGVVYTTDAATVESGEIGMIVIPDNLNTIASYPIAPTKNAKSQALAQQFVEYVLSPAGQQILVRYGFLPANGSGSDAAPTPRP